MLNKIKISLKYYYVELIHNNFIISNLRGFKHLWKLGDVVNGYVDYCKFKHTIKNELKDFKELNLTNSTKKINFVNQINLKNISFIYPGSKEKVFPVSGLGGGADVKWQHITIIKNGPLVGLATNGIFPTTWKYFTMTDDQQNSMKSGEVR